MNGDERNQEVRSKMQKILKKKMMGKKKYISIKRRIINIVRKEERREEDEGRLKREKISLTLGIMKEEETSPLVGNKNFFILKLLNHYTKYGF